ncbi:efflux RND transporter permease subunit [Candidatus Fermentibacteria bacterium]|nr:efflux RND transporter permease subunit [Candidatus Fermentibacteria bacterium]
MSGTPSDKGGLAQAVLSRPRGLTVLYVAIAVLGAVSVARIPVEGTPKLSMPTLTVEAQWPGASPEAVCERVTRLVEGAVRAVEGLEEISSTSGFGTARITASFAKGTDMDMAAMEVGERIAGLMGELPPGVRPPRVRPFVPTELRTRGFLIYSLAGDAGALELTRLAQEIIAPRLQRIDGVAGVTISGTPQQEAVIDLRRVELRRLGLSAAGVAAALATGRLDRGVGLARHEGRDTHLRLTAGSGDLKDLGEVVICRSGPTTVRLADIASIRRGVGDEPYVIRYNGTSHIGLAVERAPQGNALRIARRVEAAVAELRRELPAGTTLSLEYDDTRKVRSDLADLRTRSAVSLGLILASLLLFYPSFHAAVVVFSTILFSATLTVTAMYWAGISVNVLTITALALGFGLLVDGAIVVTEAVAIHRRGGASPLRSSVQSVRTVAAPIAGSILTTAVALGPLVASQGTLKLYYAPFAFTVCMTLAASYLVSLTLVPTLASRFGLAWCRGRPFDAALAGVTVGLSRHPWVGVASGLLLVGGAWWVLITKVHHGREWSFRREGKTVYAYLTMPPGTPQRILDGQIRRFESALASEEGVAYYVASVSGEAGQVMGYLDDDAAESGRAFEIESRLVAVAAGIAGAKSVSVGGVSPFPYYSGSHGIGLQSTIELRGFDYQGLKQLARGVAALLENHPRVRGTDINATGGVGSSRHQMVLTPWRDRMAAEGLPVHQGLWAAMHEMGARSGGRIRAGEDDLYLRFTVDGARYPAVADVAAAPAAGYGAGLAIGDVFHMESEAVQIEVERNNGEYIRQVGYTFLGPPGMASEFHKGVIENLALPPGYRIADPMERWRRFQDTGTGALGLFVAAAVVVVFMVTATLFDSLTLPLVVMLAIPLAVVGVAGAYWAFGRTFTPEAYVGAIFLVGIAVNNAILLVDAVRRLRGEGSSSHEAIEGAIRERTRPVLITTLTTASGMVPLAVAAQSGATLWSTLAFTAIAGLVVSTPLVMTVVPAVLRLTLRDEGRAG